MVARFLYIFCVSRMRRELDPWLLLVLACQFTPEMQSLVLSGPSVNVDVQDLATKPPANIYPNNLKSLVLLAEAPFFRDYSHCGKAVENVPLCSMRAFVNENWSLHPAAFANYLFSYELVSNFFSSQLSFPSSHSFFRTLTVRSRSSLRALAMSKVSASLCSFK